jgi:hypothetical protein
VELPFRIKFSLNRKLKGYELPAISKWHNVIEHFKRLRKKTHPAEMIKYSLDDIKKKVDELAEIINAKTDLLPTYGYSKDFAYPHIEIDNFGRLHYVIIERGEELERKTTEKLDDLLYWIYTSVTFSMASDFELKNRIEDKDCRRLMFEKQEELLGQLNEKWRLKENTEHQNILKRHPFDDLAGLRATYCGQLRKQGLAETEIDKLAYSKYPEN